MMFCKCAAGAGLQVALESARFLFSWKFDRDSNRPWAVSDRVSARSSVVPFEPFRDIACDTDVPTFGIADASEDVHETSTACLHRTHRRTACAKTSQDESNEISNARIGALEFLRVVSLKLVRKPQFERQVRLRGCAATARQPSPVLKTRCLRPGLPSRSSLGDPGERRLAGRQGFGA
jgi:hypothetical protein